jgi:hypothetical protein
MSSPPDMHIISPPEKSRIYYFSPVDEKDDDIIFTLENVCKVGIGSEGHHRIETTDGKKFIINNTWIAIELDIGEWSF